MDTIIQTDRLTKRFGSSRGIEEVTMSVQRGEAFGFLGPNGAGKTTTIRSLLDLLHPTSGSARLFGLDSRRDSLAIRARLGNLPGEFAYEPRRTGRELLRFLAQVRGMKDLGAAPALAERFSAELDRPLGELSRGNRQKIGLVQAMFHEPELLILDEPTGGLDPLVQEQFHEVISEQRGRGVTVFLSSHMLDEVEALCDRVGIIREGRLVDVEPVSTLTRRSYRIVTVEFAEPVDAAEFERLPGISELSVDGTRVTFKAAGALDPIVKALARHPVRDLQLEHPSLEEIFLTYYAGDHQRAAA